ncbi:type II secretion system protein [Candidatus Aerophobetes bacterium]|nr:type II secretion system protein [Candidatus Aerophobetes bacterium]
MNRVFKKEKAGFTLVELLVVVAIIGVLVSIAIPNFMGAVVRTKVAKAFTEIRGLGNVVEVYRIDHNSLPATTSDFTQAIGISFTVIPKDPFNQAGSRTLEEGALGEGGYGYYTSADIYWLIVSNGPDNTPDVTSGGINWTAQTVGQLGGWEGADTGYGYTWYNPDAGIYSSGDLGIGGP